jgi:hypothetical protein
VSCGGPYEVRGHKQLTEHTPCWVASPAVLSAVASVCPRVSPVAASSSPPPLSSLPPAAPLVPVAAVPRDSASMSNAALVGGAVGGAVAGVLVLSLGCALAVVLVRRRRSPPTTAAEAACPEKAQSPVLPPTAISGDVSRQHSVASGEVVGRTGSGAQGTVEARVGAPPTPTVMVVTGSNNRDGAGGAGNDFSDDMDNPNFSMSFVRQQVRRWCTEVRCAADRACSLALQTTQAATCLDVVAGVMCE